MLFKDMKQGHSVHIFNRKNAEYQQGVIAADPSLPHYQSPQPSMVVDVPITIGSETKTYSIPESLTTTYCGDLCISTDVSAILNEVDQLSRQAETAIAAIPTWEEIQKRCSNLRETLNPEVKEKKLLDQRMTNLENNMNSISTMFKELMKKFD